MLGERRHAIGHVAGETCKHQHPNERRRGLREIVALGHVAIATRVAQPFLGRLLGLLAGAVVFVAHGGPNGMSRKRSCWPPTQSTTNDAMLPIVSTSIRIASHDFSDIDKLKTLSCGA